MADEKFISKIKLASGTTVSLKDATARANLATLLGDHALAAIGAAGWLGAETSITSESSDSDVATAKATKAYVDAQVGAIHNFDIVVCAAEADKIPAGAIYKDGETSITGTMAATADTMWKIYLVKNSDGVSGNYVEYLTVRNGSEGSYTYSWEAIGTTAVDLSDYVKKTTKIAGIDLQDDISVSELQVALGLGNMAYADTASGSTSLSTIDSITMNDVTVAGNATVTSTSTAASLTKGDYTPAGSITGSAISGGSINVTLKDQTTATEASLTTATYTPAGTIAATEGGSFSALKSASFGEDAENGIQIAGTVSKPDVTLTSAEKTFATGLKGGKVASFTEGAFTPASISDGFFSAGAKATYSHSGFSGGSLGDATTSAFATEGVTAALDTTDTEMLVFTAAGTSDAVTAQGTYTAAVYGTDTFDGGTLPSIDTTKFSGGSKAADTFAANELQDVNTDTVNNVTAAALASTPTFTGNKYKVTTTTDTALKEVAFTATNSADIVNKVEYVKQDVDTHTFTGTDATLGFSGTKAENILVTGVNYDKADSTAAYSTTVTPTTKTLTRTDKTISVTVSPDSKE